MLKILSYQRHYLCACWVARIPLSYSVAGGAPSAQWQDVGAAPRVALPINLWPTRRGEGDSPKLSVLSCQFTEKRRVPQGPPSDDEDGVPQSTFPLCLAHPAGGPGDGGSLVLTCESWRVYQFSNSRRSRETRKVPQVRFGNLGLRVSDAFWVEALLRQRGSAFHYLQLLPPVATVEDGACARPLRAGIGKSPRRDGISPGRVRGDAGACTSADQ